MLSGVLTALRGFTLADFLDILLLSFILYSFFRLIKDTKAYQMAIGLGIIMILFLITQWGNLLVSNRLIKSFISYLIIAIIILFQGEIRRFLTSIGSRSIIKKENISTFEDLFQAVEYLSSKKIGAIIAIEKEISLESYSSRGVEINAQLSKDLLASIFFPHSPLHDGAVIIRENKILAAGCLLPLPATHTLGKQFKTRTRHLAALGLAQETDSVIVVVSEETGTISLATEGYLERGLDKAQLKERIKSQFI
ncbi:MAG: TIGR00159 family protein [Candidatus Aminicenantes bacterium]|nr:TIGR00159 family protein [Candidatus Aminicenantes bacterium]